MYGQREIFFKLADTLAEPHCCHVDMGLSQLMDASAAKDAAHIFDKRML